MQNMGLLVIKLRVAKVQNFILVVQGVEMDIVNSKTFTDEISLYFMITHIGYHIFEKWEKIFSGVRKTTTCKAI